MWQAVRRCRPAAVTAASGLIVSCPEFQRRHSSHRVQPAACESWSIFPWRGRESYEQRKAKVLQHPNENLAAVLPLSKWEAALEQSVYRPAVAAASIDPAKNFLECKSDYDSSTLLPLLRRMPKGAVLHTHGLASMDFSVLVEHVRRDGHIYIWQGGGSDVLEGTLKAFENSKAAGEGWVPAADVPKEKLYGYITLEPNLPTVEACWDAFGKLWGRVLPGLNVAPFWLGRGGGFWSYLKSLVDQNVAYVEIKEALFVPMTEYDGSALSNEEWLKRFRETVLAFQAEHPEFLGARLVLTALKNVDADSMRQSLKEAVSLKEQFPDLVAGFDMAGPEDLLKTIEDYATALVEETAAARRRRIDLPLLLHAGETNKPEAAQVIDAVLVGCERVGHGFALARHPALVKDVKARGISLECCPISNQVLGYCPNLANHAALGLFRSGVPIHISPDDPGMWHYGDVSYDFAVVAKAWNLSLAEIKALARNSLSFSTLRGQEKAKALKEWESKWQSWVRAELDAAGVTVP